MTVTPEPPAVAAAADLSVVVVILAGREYLRRCLTALSRQNGGAPAEIIVPHDDGLGDIPGLSREFPAVRFVRLEGRRSFAELRSLGFRTARGRIVALTEDHCTPDADWCAEILAAHRGPWAAVGGAVDKSGSDTTLNWAIYLNDFSRYMNPVQEGPSGYLTDCNVSYKRVDIEPIADLWSREFHETTVNWALLGRGRQLLITPRVVVRQQRSLRLGPALRERFAFGRLFASTRVAATTLPKRAVYAATAAGLPALILARVARNVGAKRRNVGRFVRACPTLLLLTSVWALGEFVGYLTGSAGDVVEGQLPFDAA